MHPFEDFAEVFGHFLHIADSLQTAQEFGLIADVERVDPLETPMAELLARTWLPLAKGLNQINRSMGRSDLYPFVLAQSVIVKLAFVADLVTHANSQ
jgi:hypothetical protein